MNTITGNMISLSNRFNAVMANPFPKIPSAPLCGAPHHFIYDNNGGNGQYQCKVCRQAFCSGDVVTVPIRLTCPHCGNTLVAKKDRKFFRIHKCVNPKCPYYLYNLKKVEQKDLVEDYGKNKYKLHYIYREFTVDFFAMDLNSLPKECFFPEGILQTQRTYHVPLPDSAYQSRTILEKNISGTQRPL